jgi:hypothetical protein
MRLIERYRILGAMLALGEFNVTELAALSGIPEATVRAAPRRERRYVERVGTASPHQPIRRRARWRVRPEARERLRALLQEMEDAGVGPWLGERSSDPHALPAGIIAAEDVLLRLTPAAADPARRAELVKLAEAQVRIADATWPASTANEPGGGSYEIHWHRRIVDLLLALERAEQRTAGNGRAQSSQDIVFLIEHLLLATSSVSDELLETAVRQRLGMFKGEQRLRTNHRHHLPSPGEGLTDFTVATGRGRGNPLSFDTKLGTAKVTIRSGRTAKSLIPSAALLLEKSRNARADILGRQRWRGARQHVPALMILFALIGFAVWGHPVATASYSLNLPTGPHGGEKDHTTGYGFSLPRGYSVVLGVSKPTLASLLTNGSAADMWLNPSGTFISPLNGVKIFQLPDSLPPTYQSCARSSAIESKAATTPGTTFCLVEANRIVGVTVAPLGPAKLSPTILRVSIWPKR